MHQVPRFEQAAITALDQRSSHWSDPREARTHLRVFQTYISLTSEIASFPRSPFRT